MKEWKLQISSNDVNTIEQFEYALLDNCFQVNISTKPVIKDGVASMCLYGEKAGFDDMKWYFPTNADLEIYTMNVWGNEISYYKIHNQDLVCSWKENISDIENREAIKKFNNYGF